MTIGKVGELKMICGGMEGLTVTVGWQEQMDAAANASVLSVTGITMDGGGRVGRVYINGTIGVNGSVLARLSDNSHWADITQVGTPAAEANGSYPMGGVVVPHSADGTAKVVLTVQLTGSCPELGQHYYASQRQEAELTDLARVSQVTAATGRFGEDMTVLITAPSEELRHTLRYACGELTGTIAEGLGGGSHVWSVPLELCAAVPHSTAAECTVYCDTYRGESLGGSASVTVALQVPAAVGLTLEDGWLTLAPDNSGTIAEGLGCYVQGRSRLQVIVDESKITCGQAYGASIASVTVTVDGEAVAPGDAPVLHRAGRVPVGCTVTDTRGRRIRQVETVEVHPYAAPVLSAAEPFRCTEDGTAHDEGSCLCITAHCRHSPLGGGNGLTLTAALCNTDGTTVDTAVVTAGEPAVLWAGLVSPMQTYTLRLQAVDSLGSKGELTFTVPTAQVFFHGHRDGTGAAFGKYAEQADMLEVAWSLKTKGDLLVEGSAVIGGKTLTDWLYPVGAVFTCSGDADPAALFGGSWAPATDGVQQWLRTE